MNQTELQALEHRFETLRGDDLFDMRCPRTLMYGYDCEGTVRHTYVDQSGNIRGVVYAQYSMSEARDTGWAILAEYSQDTCSNRDYVPAAQVVASLTDYEFACRMVEASMALVFDQPPRADSRSSVLLPPCVHAARRFVALPLGAMALDEAIDRLARKVGYHCSNARIYVLEEDAALARRLVGPGAAIGEREGPTGGTTAGV